MCENHLADCAPPEPPRPCAYPAAGRGLRPHLPGFLGLGRQCGENLALENWTVTSLGAGRCFLYSVTSSATRTDVSVCSPGRGGQRPPRPWSSEGHHSPGHLWPPSVVAERNWRACPPGANTKPAPAVMRMKDLSPRLAWPTVDPGPGEDWRAGGWCPAQSPAISY